MLPQRQQQGFPLFTNNNSNNNQQQPIIYVPSPHNSTFNYDQLFSHTNTGNTFAMMGNQLYSPPLSSSGFSSVFSSQGSTPQTPIYLFASPSSPQITKEQRDRYFNLSCECIVKYSEWIQQRQYPIFPTEMFQCIESSILDGVCMEGSIHVPVRDFHYLHAWCIHTVLYRMGIPILQMPITKVSSGGFGQVYRISQDKVIKIVDDKNNSGTKEALKQFNHPHLLELKESFVYPGGGLLLLVFPFMKHGTLRNKKFTLIQLWKIVWQLANGLEHLHKKDIVHRDIKLDNVLIEEMDETETIKVVLSDFGLSRNTDSCSSGAAGTESYIAPELLESGEIATDESDIYSLGKTVASVCLGESVSGIIKFKPCNSLTDLLNRMMDKKPYARPKTKEIQEICVKEFKLLLIDKKKFTLSKSDLSSNEPLKQSSSNESKLFMSSNYNLEDDFSKMSISKQSKAYEIDGQIRYLSDSSTKTKDAMSISDSKPKKVITKENIQPSTNIGGLAFAKPTTTQPTTTGITTGGFNFGNKPANTTTTAQATTTGINPGGFNFGTTTNREKPKSLIYGNDKTSNIIEPQPLLLNTKQTPAKQQAPPTKQTSSHKYSFKLHKDGCVDAKRVILFKCNAEARKAIKSVKLQVKNSGASTGLLDVTSNIEPDDAAETYVISKSQKSALLKNVQFTGQRGKDEIELYINDQLVDTAPFVAKNQ